MHVYVLVFVFGCKMLRKSHMVARYTPFFCLTFSLYSVSLFCCRSHVELERIMKSMSSWCVVAEVALCLDHEASSDDR